jgi:hypothetical protein
MSHCTDCAKYLSRIDALKTSHKELLKALEIANTTILSEIRGVRLGTQEIIQRALANAAKLASTSTAPKANESLDEDDHDNRED